MTELLAPSADGHPVSARDTGSGPCLLVVHPGGGDASSWDAVAELLQCDFRVVRPQRRLYAAVGADGGGVGATVGSAAGSADAAVGSEAGGAGAAGSEGAAGFEDAAGSEDAAHLPHSVALEAADVLAVAELLDPPLVLVGHSSGAVVALEAALAKPKAFAGLVLYEPPLPTRTLVGGPAVVRAREVYEGGDPVEAMRIHLRDIVRFPAEWVDTMLSEEPTRSAFATHAGAQIADAEAIDALGVGTERFAELDLPTVLIEGDASPVHLRERLADLAAVLPRVEVVTLAGQGHVAHLVAPDLLAGTVRDAAWRIIGG